jgi:cytochrome c
MKFAPTSAAVLALVFALTACGGNDQDGDETAAPTVAATGPGQDIGPTPGETSTPVPSDTPSATPSETPSPTPTASPSAAATTAAATEPAAFAQCKACHSVEPGKNGIGPSLAGVFGDRAGTQPGFEFSDAMKNSGLVLNQSGLDRYLTDPRGVVPGTKMAFGGVKDAAQRQAIINYLKTL